MKRVNTSSSMLLVIFLGLMMLIVGCSSEGTNNQSSGGSEADNNGSTSESESELEPVELTWYFPLASIPADIDKVEEAVNEITKEKINATIDFKTQTFGDYTERLNLVVASGENADIIWTSNWNFDYMQNQANGAFIPLDELLEEYAPDVLNSMPDFIWDATRINGEIYGVPNYQTVTNREAYRIVASAIDQYDLDIDAISDPFTDITPILETIKQQGADNVVPLHMDRRGLLESFSNSLGIELVDKMGAIRWEEPTKVFNVFASPEYKEYLDLVYDWYQGGLINQDAPTLSDTNDLIASGRVVSEYHHVNEPGVEIKSAQKYGEEVQVKFMTDPYVGTGSIITTLQAISRTSENPERAMMFLNLVNTDPELYNLLIYGIEGEHYTMNEDNVVEPIEDSGYAPGADWIFGNTFNAYPVAGKDPAINDAIKEENENATPSPMIGFKFDVEPVASQIANITSVMDQHGPGLNTGAVSPDEGLDEFLSALERAGINEVIDEMQSQLDKWHETNEGQ
ncbi:ABC transporter substrate-binding protein [Bacillaceae bacterium SIJ1]|uniref:ABC transporter substrate-binding protein n=1 Tax=Litoribacterium kuwaitense TaxID=1398745 RepID=UPI0013EB6639|nr:ABC transporter substrate-binding protein [Litoribacterium kuwaitense]NGP44904.1 ABC transporter substrate-binding protein [Litoribacterium kuwaitense]